MKTVEAASLEGLALPLGFEPAHARVRVGPEGPEVVLWEAWKLEWGRLGGVGAYWAEVHLRAEDGAAALVLVERRHNWESKELVLAGPREDPRYALRVPTGRGRKFFSLLPALETALTSLLPAFRGRRVLPAALKAKDALRKLAPLVKGRAPFARRGGFSLVRGREGAVLWNAEAAPPWLRPLLDLLPEGGPALLPLPGAEGAALEVSVRPDPEDPGRAEVFLEGLRLGRARFLPLQRAALPLFGNPSWEKLVDLGFGLKGEEWAALREGKTGRAAKALALRRLGGI